MLRHFEASQNGIVSDNVIFHIVDQPASDEEIFLKLFRRLQPGENPDTEIGRFLTEVAHFPRIAPFLGDIRLVVQNGTESGEPTTLAMLQGLIQNEGDGWQWTLDEISRYYDSCVTCPLPHDLGRFPTFTGPSDHGFIETVREHAGLYIEAAALLHEPDQVFANIDENVRRALVVGRAFDRAR